MTPLYYQIFRKDPLTLIWQAVVILVVSTLVGLGLPWFCAKDSGVLDSAGVENKIQHLPQLQVVWRKTQSFKVRRDSIHDRIAQINSMLASTNGIAEVRFARLLSQRQFLVSTLAAEKDPYVIRGYYQSSTVFLWPAMLSCLGWLLLLFSPPAVPLAKRSWRGWWTFFVIYGIYRLPIIARNTVFGNEGRLFYGHANLDVDWLGFLVQELLGILVTLLLTLLWMRWTYSLSTYRRQLATKVTDPLKAIFDKKKITMISSSFLHWQLCSLILVGAFIGYSYMYWNYIFVVGDQRYLFNGIVIHLLWLVTWIIMTLPLLAVWQQWQFLKAKALYYVITQNQVENLDTNSLIIAINDLHPVSFLNLTVSGLGVLLSFLLPLIQLFIK